MKIAYLTDGGECYQSVCLFHGLRTLLGDEVVDYPRLKPAYQGEGAAYGCGFTAYNHLPDIDIDRSDMEAKLAGGHFDAVIWNGWPVYWAETLPFGNVPLPSTVVQVIVDGGDYMANSRFSDRGLYFKREWCGKGHPFGFAIPKEMIVDHVPEKTRLWSFYEPYMPHIYKVESDYREGYRRASLGITHLKSGWDCMRHYEIMSQGCVPFFLGVDRVPEGNLTQLPLDLFKEVLYKYWSFYISRIENNIRPAHWSVETATAVLGYPQKNLYGRLEELPRYAELMLNHVRTHNTTEVLARKVLDAIKGAR